MLVSLEHLGESYNTWNKDWEGGGGIAIVDASPSQLPKKKLHTDSQQYPLNLCLSNN